MEEGKRRRRGYKARKGLEAIAKKKRPVAAATTTTASQPASKQAAGVAEAAIGRAAWRVGAGKIAGERAGGAAGSER
jgi:hypothetical protein